MDDTDRKIMLLIYSDPRIPIQELAKRVGISRQAASNRLQTLTEMGVFRSMRATCSVHYLDTVVVAIWGKSESLGVEKNLDRLGESELTARAIIAGGNEVYVFGALRNVSELDGYVDFVRRVVQIPEPTVGIVSYGDGINPDTYDGGKSRQKYRQLSSLDFKIIASLQGNARKSAAEIADSIGASPKTVARHLERMRQEESMDFSQPLDLTLGEDMLTLIHMRIRSGADKVKVARRHISRDPFHLVLIRSFSNLPDFLLGVICSDKMGEIAAILRGIREDEDILSVTPNLIYHERTYWTWRLGNSQLQDAQGSGIGQRQV